MKRIEPRYRDDNKGYYRIDTDRNEGGKEEAKGEIGAETRPELYRQVAGDRDFLREQRAEIILQLSRKIKELRECRVI